jgi:hypothetical protein
MIDEKNLSPGPGHYNFSGSFEKYKRFEANRNFKSELELKKRKGIQEEITMDDCEG